MARDELDSSRTKRRAGFRLCTVSSYTTELLEIRADDPKMNVLFIPGNPGVVTFYKDFVESLYEFLGGNASITAIGHISHTKKNWEHGRLFSLEEQIDHKMDFIKQELENTEVPILLVGHSIGSYIALDMFRRSSEKVAYCIGLYPFLALNPQSREQSIIGKITASQSLSAALSLIVASLGFLPIRALRFILTNSLGKSWSTVAVEAACSHLVQYHTMRNVFFMAMTEFRKVAGLLACWWMGGRSRSAVVWKMVPLCIMWCLWLERNERCFEDSERSLEELTAFFFHTLYTWTAAWLAPIVISYPDFLVLFSSSS